LVHATAFSFVPASAITTSFSDDSVSLREIRIGLGIFLAFIMGTSGNEGSRPPARRAIVSNVAERTLCIGRPGVP
jgi:hypothetical protein